LLDATKERRLSKALPLLISLRSGETYSMDDLQFFNPYEGIRFTANRLPHWQQKGAVYFVTFRLADAVPQHLRTQWESERFDRLVRDARHLANCIRYIRRNPTKARLHAGESVPYESELAKSIA
jgi:hypothetical protein